MSDKNTATIRTDDHVAVLTETFSAMLALATGREIGPMFVFWQYLAPVADDVMERDLRAVVPGGVMSEEELNDFVINACHELLFAYHQAPGDYTVEGPSGERIEMHIPERVPQ